MRSVNCEPVVLVTVVVTAPLVLLLFVVAVTAVLGGATLLVRTGFDFVTTFLFDDLVLEMETFEEGIGKGRGRVKWKEERG